jgi:pilus assembly protein CpaE
MQRDNITVRLAIRDETVKKGFEEMVSSVDDFHIIHGKGESVLADLLILEIGSDLEREFQLIQSLQNLGTGTEVFLTSRHSDPAVLVKAIRAGAKEFFAQPIQTQEIRDALERYRERRGKKTAEPETRMGRIIDVIGAKGGVGTTTIAVNLAVSLLNGEGSPSVAVIDMNPFFGEIPIFLDIEPAYHWNEIAKNISRLDTTFLMSTLSRHDSGIYVLPSAGQLDGQNVATPEITERVLDLMRSVFDFVVIDAGQHTDEISLKMYEISDTVLIISVLSLPCLANANRLLKSLYGIGYPLEKTKVVINRCLKHPEISVREAEDSIKQKVFGTIPNDYRTTMSAINQGHPFCGGALRKPVARGIHELANALTRNGAESWNRSSHVTTGVDKRSSDAQRLLRVKDPDSRSPDRSHRPLPDRFSGSADPEV